SSLKQMTTKKGDPMVFAGLEDVTGFCEVVAFNSVYAHARDLLVQDSIVVVKGRIDQKGAGETKLVAIEITGFEATPERREVRLKVDARIAPAAVEPSVDLVATVPAERARLVGEHLAAVRSDQPVHEGHATRASESLFRVLRDERGRPTTRLQSAHREGGPEHATDSGLPGSHR